MLLGRNALVTGSTSGMGLEMAKALAKAGANVMVNGFGPIEKAMAEIHAASTLSSMTPRVEYHGADMSKPAEIEDMMKYLEFKFEGSLDILINNAGIQYVSRVVDFPVANWDMVLSINLSSAFHTSRLALPGMQKKNFGRIINIASVHGTVASAEKSAYVAAKHGIIGLTKAIALEYATTGITCNAICPGFVLTPLVQKQVSDRAIRLGVSEDEAKDSLLSEKQPSRNFVKSEQLAALALFLCSDAASEVRGAAWNMDGGWTAQ